MAEETKKTSSLPAILGWGGLLLFMVLFAWLIISQLRSAEIWSGREQDARTMVKQFRPEGGDTLDDLTKKYSARARERDAYVGEFTWDAKQGEGPEYEVTLLWKEGEEHRVALWRVNLEKEDVRPQGNAAASLPQRASDGGSGSSVD